MAKATLISPIVLLELDAAETIALKELAGSVVGSTGVRHVFDRIYESLDKVWPAELFDETFDHVHLTVRVDE